MGRKLAARFPLWTVLNVPFAIILSVSVGLIGYLNIRSGTTMANNLTNQLLAESAINVQQNMDSYLAIPRLLNDHNLAAMRLNQLDLMDALTLERQFLAQMLSFPNIAAITFANEQREFITTSWRPNNAGLAFAESTAKTGFTLNGYEATLQGERGQQYLSLPDYDPRTRPWYQAAVTAGHATWTPIYIWIRGEGIGLDAVTPIYTDRGDLLGVLDVSLFLSGISNFLKDALTTYNGNVFIVDEAGLLVASSTMLHPFVSMDGKDERLDTKKPGDRLIESASRRVVEQLGEWSTIKSNQQFTFELAGESQLAQVVPYQSSGLRWWIVVIVPEATYMTSINENINHTLQLIFASLIVSIGLLTLVSRWITQSILQLNLASKTFAAGNWSERLPINRRDELGELAASFNHMADQLQKSTASLQASETRLRAIFENSSEAIVVNDEKGLVTYNPAFQAMLGYSASDELIGKPVVDYIAPAEKARIADYISRRSQGESAPLVYETRGSKQNGAEFDLEVRVSTYFQNGSQHTLALLRDVTERKQIEAAEREQRAMAEALRDTAESLVQSLELDLVMANILENISRVVPHDVCNIMLIRDNMAYVAYCRGWSAEFEAMVRALWFPLSTPNLHKMIQTRRPVFIADTATDPSWILTALPTHSYVGAPIQVHGEVIGFLSLDSAQPNFYTARHAERLGAFADQAAIAIKNAQLYEELHKYAQQLEQRVNERTVELQRAKDQVEAILNSSSDGVILVKGNGTIRQTNPAFTTLFARSPDENLNLSLSDLFLPESASLLQENLLATTHGATKRLEIQARRRDGTIFESEIGLSPVMENSAVSDAVVCILRDITERKQAEAALKQRNLALSALQMGALEIAAELDIPALLDRIMKRAVNLLNAQRGGGIYLYDSEANILRLEAVSGINEGRIGITLQPDEGVVGQVLRTGQSLIVQDYTQWGGRATVLISDPPSTVMGVPLVIQGQVAGVLLVIANSAERTFTPDDIQLAEMFAAQAATAFRNAQLYSAAQREIAERIRTERALRESEERFRQIAENFDQGLFIRSGDYRQLLYANPVYEKLTGKSQQFLYQNPDFFLQIVHPDDLDLVRQQTLDRHFMTDGLADFEYRIIASDQQMHWIRLRMFPIKNSDGAIALRTGIIEDVTERKRADTTLKESEEKYRRLVETMRGGLVMFDVSAQVTYVNDRFCELFGYRRDELIGTNVHEYLDNTAASELDAKRKKRQQGVSAAYETVVKHKDGHPLHLLTATSPLLGKNGENVGSVAVITDITAQKQAEEALRKTLEQEKELGELKTRFVSTASHEFRTPLATILALTETLSAYRQKMLDEEIAENLDKIREQVEYLKTIMDDVLQLARLQAGRANFSPVRLNLDSLCRNVINEFESQQDVNCHVLYSCNDALREVKLDRKLMRQIINNLVSNAVKYSPEGKSISVSLNYTDEAVTLRVTDEGIGIPETDLKHLFEPFHRAANVGTISGTGLGLVITRESVELHGGTITVESQVAVGTTFTVNLPITPDRDKAHDKNSAD